MTDPLKITVVPMSRRDPPHPTPVVLMQNNWDDFGFKTSYVLYYSGPAFTGMIGGLKILRRGQQPGPDSLIDVGEIGDLPEDWVSIGNSLDYYQRLAGLPLGDRNAILRALNDATHDPNHAVSFEGELGWQKSILRDIDLEEIRSVASVLLHRDYTSLPARSLALSFQMAGWTRPLELRFDSGSDDDVWRMPGTPRQGLPERMAVVVGRNSSGKSTLLARLARVLHASQADRAKLAIKRLGQIEPAGIGFARIITVAYSAFDTFQVPGVGRAERRQIISDLRTGEGRYVFCGLRDIARELEERIEESDASLVDADEDAQNTADAAADAQDWFTQDRLSTIYLKSIDALAAEFRQSIEIAKAGDRAALLYETAGMLLSDASFADVPDQSLDDLLGEDLEASFARWSTGHKIVMHTLAAIVAHARPKSIILLDEPESHLHPPLLAALMHAIRRVLDDQDSFALVATHSPVVAQETLRRHVSVVNRAENVTTILPPRIETYGESFGEIANEVFGLNPNATDFHKTLRTLVTQGLSLADIEARFDQGMSLQARAYVMTLIAERGV